MNLPLTKLSLSEFLIWENQQTDRNEFYRGEVFAMVGARRIHGLLTLNLATSLKQQLKGTPCRTFVESMKVQVGDDSLFYPDVFVTCDPADLSTDYIFRSPTVIVEILSESTEAFDRGVKFATYRRISALKEYLMIDPDTRGVELYRRGDDGLFTLHDYSGVEAFSLVSIGCKLTREDVFEGL